MLLELTALALSLSLGGGSADFGVLEAPPVLDQHVRQVDIAPATVPSSAAFGAAMKLTPVDITLLPKLGGRALLDQLSILPADTLGQYVKDHPGVIADVLSRPIAVVDVAQWWGSASQAVRQKLTRQTPELIGNLEGIPFAVRDAANRAYLGNEIAKLEAQLRTGVGRGMNVEVTNHLHMLTQIRAALTPDDDTTSRTLVSLNTTAPGRAAIAIGDLTTADYVSYLIPGMLFTIDGQIDYWADTATTLYQDQLAWLSRLGDSSSTVATIAWVGYQTPHLLNVGSLTLAEQGADYLTRSIEGLQGVRGSHQPYLSVVAHSYGSTAVMMALQHADFQIDALAVVGSPGSSAQSVSALAVRGGNVYVGEADGDPVANTAFYGSDPGAPAYGAHRMGVSGGIDAVTGQPLSPSIWHIGYFERGSESMRNFALIGINAGGLVMNDAGVTIAAAGK